MISDIPNQGYCPCDDVDTRSGSGALIDECML